MLERSRELHTGIFHLRQRVRAQRRLLQRLPCLSAFTAPSQTHCLPCVITIHASNEVYLFSLERLLKCSFTPMQPAEFINLVLVFAADCNLFAASGLFVLFRELVSGVSVMLGLVFACSSIALHAPCDVATLCELCLPTARLEQTSSI